MIYRFVLIFICFGVMAIFSDDGLPELQVKRKNVFEFTKEPIITKSGDTISIEFSVKDFCDVTVAVQNLDGDIVRHLASGVLGEKAPLPFVKNSLDQKIIWDSKDDRGRYIDDIKSINIRVSLGLKPMYEKDLYQTPYKRISGLPAIATGPEGLYVFEGYGRDQLRLFNHKGEYIKTVYPFPASQIEKVKGLEWISYGGREKTPFKYSAYHQTLLSSGDNGPSAFGYSVGYSGLNGKGATTICVQGKQLLIGFERINRLQIDGSTGGLNIKGPDIGIARKKGDGDNNKGIIGPASSAFSPDGKTVYFTGYLWHYGYSGYGQSGNFPVVMKLNYETDDKPVVFAGKIKQEEFGSGPDQFNTPSSVDTDTKGNVYVSDFWNNRIQVFDPTGKLIKSIESPKPARVLIHKVTNEIYVFSYGLVGVPPSLQTVEWSDFNKFPKTISTFSAFPECNKLSSEEFPLGGIRVDMFFQGNTAQIALDSWSKTPAFWVVTKKFVMNDADASYWGVKSAPEKDWLNGAIRRIEKIDNKWVEQDNLGKRVEKDIVRPKPPQWNIQHLFVNPKSKKLFVGEADSGPTGKAFRELIEIDTESGASKIVKLPFNPMDIAFDLDGLIYMRTMAVLARYNMETWKEVPFDYGAEMLSVGDDGGMGGTTSPVISGLMLPATNAVCYHQGGLDVNVNGDILVACHNRTTMSESKVAGQGHGKLRAFTEYKPDIYPGCLISATSVCLHVWDKQGKVKFQNMVPGCPQTDGVFLDKNDNVYIMAVPARQLKGKELDDGMSSTIIKFNQQKGKFISRGGEVPLPVAQEPKRPQEVFGYWVEDFEWMYGGVGFAGFSSRVSGGGCACWFARFKLDYFARTIAPEPMQYSVAVLDSNGNLITRIGRYGNVDSAGPKSKEPLGGDEVGLFHPCFVGTLTDKKLFISDIGNERIVSVKLGYHTEKVLPIIK